MSSADIPTSQLGTDTRGARARIGMRMVVVSVQPTDAESAAGLSWAAPPIEAPRLFISTPETQVSRPSRFNRLANIGMSAFCEETKRRSPPAFRGPPSRHRAH